MSDSSRITAEEARYLWSHAVAVRTLTETGQGLAAEGAMSALRRQLVEHAPDWRAR